MILSALRQLLLLLLAGAIPAGLLGAWLSSRPSAATGPGEINVAMARALPRETIIYVDARSQSEFARARVAGAIPLHVPAWETQIARLYDEWEPGRVVVVYGRPRSDDASMVADRLRRESNLPDVFVLKGQWEELAK